MASTGQVLPTRLWLVRHGESAGNLALRKAESAGSATIEIEGRDVDVPLSELGERQSRALGRWFREQPEHERPSIVISSPYVRALQTTENIARELSAANLECLVDERLREREFGELNRFTKSGIASRFPDEARRRAAIGKFYYRPPGGESWCDVALRLRSVVQDLLLNYGSERVLIVSHQVVVLCFRYVLESLGEERLLEVDRAGEVANCSITVYKESSVEGRGRLQLHEYNLVSPLEHAGETITVAPDPAVIK